MMKEKNGSLISKILAWVLTVALVAGVVPATSLAEEAPVYGTVEAITEGLGVSGKTNDETVSVENSDTVVLKWEAADTNIGRNEDGWWAGIKVTAPSGMADEDLEKITLQKSTVAGEWSDEISFKDARDAEDYVTLWTLVNPELISAGEEIAKQWQFDWDADGVYEQVISLTLDCEKIVLLDENNVQIYPKLGAVETITGGQVSGSETGTVSVIVDATTLNWSQADTEIGRNQDGWWAGIKVVAPADLSEDVLKNAKGTYIRHGETEWNPIDFWDVKDSAEGDEAHYVGLWLMLTPAILEEAKDADKHITNQYKMDWNNDGEFEQTIVFTVVPSDSIVLLKENQSELEFDNVSDSYIYGDTPEQVKVKGGNGSGAVAFEIVDCGETTGVASIDASGNLTLNKAGEFILKAVKAGDDTYNDGIAITKVIRVEAAEQQGFAFEDKQPANITFNDNGNIYTNQATGGQSTQDVRYEITSGADVADIDSSTGELTIKKAGTVLVKAVKSADEKYKAASAEYTLIIEKDTQEIIFKNGSQVDVVYGALTYSNIAEEDGTLFGTKKISYEIISGNDIATIDSTGVVSFADEKIGTVTIKASKDADDCYEACSAEYTLNIAYAATPSKSYALEGDTKNESGWYTGDVTINAPEGYTISFSGSIEDNVWDSSVVWGQEGTHDVVVYLRDSAGGITDKVVINDLKIDKTAPKDLKIEYTQSAIKKIFEKLSFGLYTAPVEVRLSATDDISGIAEFVYTYKNAKKEYSVDAEKLTSNGYSFTIEPQFRDTIAFTAVDVAGNATDIVDMEVDQDGNETGRENVIVVDTDNSKLDTVYTYATNDFDTDKDGVIYTQGDVSIQWTIDEANFDLADKPVVTVNDVEDTSVSWSQDGVGILELSGNGDYKVKMTFIDATQVTNIVYEQEIRIDEIAPEIVIDPVIEGTNAEKLYYNGPKTFEITINEHNFDLNDLTVNVISSDVLSGTEVQDYEAKIKDADKWQHSEDSHTIVVTFEEDAQYQLILNYRDMSGRTDSYITQEFVIDNVNPKLDVTLDPVDTTAKNDKYYSVKRTATITIDEHNFDAKDVKISVTPTRRLDESAAIEDYQATLNNPANWKQSPENADVYTATIDFVVDADYTFTVDYTDLSGRVATQHEEKEFVIDNVDPKLNVILAPVDATAENNKYYSVKRTATITIEEHNFDAKDVKISVTSTRKLDESVEIEDYQATLNNQANWNQSAENADVYTAIIDFTVDANYTFTVDYKDLSGRVATQHEEKEFVIDNVDPKLNVTLDPVDATAKNDKYYSVKRTATITIEEHNFDAKDVKISVTSTRKLDESVEIEDYQATLNNPNSWTQSTENPDVYTATIDFTVDANYTFTVDYKDLSGRVATQHVEREFVIDNVDPVLKSVVYTNKNVFATNEKGREYVDIEVGETVTAEITIVEHNFDAKDINVIVKATDAADEDIMYTDTQQTLEKYYKELYTNPDSWLHDGDVHTATIVYAQDANYTFDIEYVDLSGRSINATENRPADLFTIDREAPVNLKTEYSKGEETADIDGVEYEYYADKMTVTITGKDSISGIKKFAYSYLNEVGVSAVNASGSGEIDAKNIQQDGLSFTATFTIPKEALNAKNQFNGTIEFTAIDVLENSTKQKEKKRIVVDNIAPTAQISYNDPVKNANGISYYAGDVNGTIVVNEANFYSQDLQLTVTKDGVVVPITIKWVDNSVDVHTGTFTLHEDGDYIVKVDYADRSTNKISTYTSNELTVDTKQPTINVSGIKMNSANKDETYGFTITANDINFDAATFKPVLKAVVRGEDGSYETKTISLGDVSGSQDGQTYSYTVKNLEADGIYTLTCAVKDMSDNAYASIRLEDGKEYETVQFSINRDGSTFAIDEYTENVINQYYVYSVEKDIVLVEVNADPITNYSVIVNGKVLDNSEYTTTMDGGNDEWYKRTYTIPNELFKKEGEYNIVVRSTDKADTEAYSDVKNIKVAFVVDQTAPVLTISGLKDEGRYQTSEQTVTVIPTDDGGRLYSFKAVVYDDDGNPLKDENGKDISVRFEMEGEELLKYLEEHDGKITFTVPEGYKNNVQIICTDCAKNSEGATNAFDETFEKVTVSASQLVIFYANKPLFYGTVAGLVAIIGGIIFILYKKRKKHES